MTNLLLFIHVTISVAMVILVLLQKSDGGALGLGRKAVDGVLRTYRPPGGGLIRATAVLAAIFFLSTLFMTFMNIRGERAAIPGLDARRAATSVTVPSDADVTMPGRPNPAIPSRNAVRSS